MPKGMVEASTPETGLTDLRQDIQNLEVMIANLRGRGAQALDALRLRDRVQERVDQLRERGLDLRAELTRLETIDNMIRSQVRAFNRELALSGGMAAARRERRPPDDYWWWFIDIEYAQKMRRSAIRFGAIFVGVIVVLLVLNTVLDKRYGLSDVERQAYDHTAAAEKLIAARDWQGAIAEYESANAILPSADHYAWLVVLYTEQGDTAKAEEASATLDSLDVDKRAVYNQVVQNYLTVEDYDSAETWVYKALALDDQYAQTWLNLGALAEARRDTTAAIKLYEEASRLAEAQGSDALYVLARMRMAMLMGGGSSGPAGGF
ncbi:MAG: hypothetical protein ABFD20_02010 [Anaerolineales bacterium]